MMIITFLVNISDKPNLIMIIKSSLVLLYIYRGLIQKHASNKNGKILRYCYQDVLYSCAVFYGLWMKLT